MEIGILGALEAREGDRPLPLGGTKQRAVLAMLVLRLNQVVSVDYLVDGLWGEATPDSATNVMQAYVSRLRKILASAGPDDYGFGGVRRCRPGYLFDLDPERFDLYRFERLAREGAQQLSTAPEAASASLRGALELWRGSPLAEFADLPFALPETHRLEEQRLSAVASRVEADLHLGRHAELISELEVLVTSHPLHEGLQAQLMVSLFRSGRQAEALAVYRRVQQTFAEELGIDPSRQLSELESAILARDPSLDWHPLRIVTGTAPTGPDRPASLDPAPLTSPVQGGQPVRVVKVPARNPHFTGRTGVIDQLHDRLRSGENSLVVEALFGLGGVGKTQLAIEYAHRFAADYNLIWWIDAEQPVLIPDQLISLGARLGVPIDGNPSDVVDRVLMELADRRDWLLIFDNAERPDDIAGYRPGGSGHFVVTSRFPGWGALGGRLQIDVMTRSETVSMLSARIPQMGSTVAQGLAAELGDLPLATAQAAAYLEQTGLDPEDYLRQFRTRRASLLAHGDVVGYQRRVDTAWDLSLERLRAVSPAAVELLEVGAFMAPEPIPLTVFTDHPELLSGALRVAAIADSDVVADAVGAAVAFSLVNRHHDSFQLHRLVQAVIRHRLSSHRQATVGSLAVTLLSACRPGDPSNPVNWPAYARLAPHVLATGHLGDNDPDGRALMLDTVQYLNVRGDTRASRTIAEELLERWRRVLGADHPTTLNLASTLTWALAWLGEAERACELGQDTLERCRHTLGPDHPTTLSSATYLTTALPWLGEHEQAVALGHDTLQRCRKTLGPDHPTTLGSAAQLAFTLLGLGQVDSARTLSQETWELSGQTLGSHHPTTLIAAAALTFALAWLGEADTGRDLGLATVERCRQAFGLDHWLALIAASALTFALVGLAENQQARDESQEAFNRAQQAFGPDHWVTLIAAAALTFALVGLGLTEDARTLGTDTLERSIRTLGPQHPIALNLTQQLGIVDPSDGQSAPT